MADSFAFCFCTKTASITPSHALPLSPTSRPKETPFPPSASPSSFPSSSTPSPFPPRRFSFLPPRSPSRFFPKASSSGNFLGDDAFGFFPWEQHGDTGIEWVPEERITLFTADGLFQIGGRLIPHQVPSSDKKQGKARPQLSQRFQESNYMDPNQGLCLGALFDISATNGLDIGRRLCIFGFCRSVEMLSDVVEDTVLEHGGEVVAAETETKGGMHEKLTMSLAVPMLWGVPPASETLHLAVRCGGGIVEKVYWQWDFQ